MYGKERRISAKFGGRCKKCRAPHMPGDFVWWAPGQKGVLCLRCHSGTPEDPDYDNPFNRPPAPELEDEGVVCCYCGEGAEEPLEAGSEVFCSTNCYVQWVEMGQKREI